MLKWIEIDLACVKNNVKAIKSVLNPGVKFMAVVKADGYGHGAAEIARTALAAGADLLGVLTTDEGARLREQGFSCEIVSLSPPLPEEAREIVRRRLTPTADSLELVKALDAATPKGKLSRYCIDIDLGLKRWGLLPEGFGGFIKKAASFKKARPSYISTHIAYSPQKNMIEAEEKLSRFSRLRGAARACLAGIKAHAANSSVLCDFPHWQLDMVRIGNLIYGIYPAKVYSQRTKGPPIKGLERPWKFYSRLISIREVKKGESLGYSSEYVACRKMRIATIPVGYCDGLTMEPSERHIKLSAGTAFWGIIRGKEAPFVGKSGIAHTLLDITGIPGASTGDPVLLPIRRTAASARIPRIYKSALKS